MKNSLLFGNGINLAIGGFPQWTDLLDKNSNLDSESTIPYPLQFEESISSSEDVLKDDYKRKQQIQEDLINIVDKVLVENSKLDLLEEMRKLRFDNYLTTNFDNLFYRYLLQQGVVCTSPSKSGNLYSLTRRYNMRDGDHLFSFWTIHGNIDYVPSMILGYNHYCGNVGKMTSFLKGDNYEYTVIEDGKFIKKLLTSKDSMISRLKIGKLSIRKLRTWVDLFFTTNVHIIGLGMGFDEIDLWWLLNFRERLKKDPRFSNQIQNDIYYYDIDPTKLTGTKQRRILDVHHMLVKLGVSVVTDPETQIEIDADGTGKVTNYPAIYQHLFEKIKANVTQANKVPELTTKS